MDFTSAPSSSGASLGSNGSFVDDEGDGHIPVAAGLAREASVFFQMGRYSECIDVLNQLLQKKPGDPKVLHNIAIAEYFRDGCSDPRKLLDVLNSVKRIEVLSHIFGEQAEVADSPENGKIPENKGNSETLHQVSSSSNPTYTDVDNTAVATLNYAVVLYHLGEYANALSVLEPLYRKIEPIDVTTALHICLLLLDVALALQDVSKAADVILYLEKAFGISNMISQGDNGTIVPEPSNQPAKIISSPSTFPASDASDPDSSVNSGSDNQLTRTLSDETLEYESLVWLDIGGQMARPPLLAQNEQLGPAVDLKIKLHLYKVRLLLLTRNLKATKHELKLAVNIARGRDLSAALLLKAQLEYARGNYRKAIKLLMTSINRTEAGGSSTFHNNLGCIHHQLKKHQTSIVFFSKALKESSSLRSEKPLKLATFSQDKSFLILYNCGLEYLQCGKPMVAAQCFHKVSSIFCNQPLLWVRLAECCLMAVEKGHIKSGAASAEVVTLHVVGSERWRHVVVKDATRNRHSVEGSAMVCGDLNEECRSLPYARQCLLNALHLLNNFGVSYSSVSALEDDSLVKTEESFNRLNLKNALDGASNGSHGKAVGSAFANANGDMKENKGILSINMLQDYVSAYKEICKKEYHMVKQAVLADLAYVELQLENPLKALSVARSLLQLSDSSKVYQFFGHIYAAEALCQLNRSKEAAEELSIYMAGQTIVKLPYSEEDPQRWMIEKIGGCEDGVEINGTTKGPANLATGKVEPSQASMFLKPEEARGVLYVNLAAISAAQGDQEQAHKFIAQALTIIPSHPKAVVGAAYVDLLLGRTQEALVKLKLLVRAPRNVTH